MYFVINEDMTSLSKLNHNYNIDFYPTLYLLFPKIGKEKSISFGIRPFSFKFMIHILFVIGQPI